MNATSGFSSLVLVPTAILPICFPYSPLNASIQKLYDPTLTKLKNTALYKFAPLGLLVRRSKITGMAESGISLSPFFCGFARLNELKNNIGMRHSEFVPRSILFC